MEGGGEVVDRSAVRFSEVLVGITGGLPIFGGGFLAGVGSDTGSVFVALFVEIFEESSVPRKLSASSSCDNAASASKMGFSGVSTGFLSGVDTTGGTGGVEVGTFGGGSCFPRIGDLTGGTILFGTIFCASRFGAGDSSFATGRMSSAFCCALVLSSLFTTINF